jgi:hypothetical protein
VKDETGKHSTVEEKPSSKINNNIINSPKFIPNLIRYLYPNTCRKIEQLHYKPDKGRGNTEAR